MIFKINIPFLLVFLVFRVQKSRKKANFAIFARMQTYVDKNQNYEKTQKVILTKRIVRNRGESL